MLYLLWFCRVCDVITPEVEIGGQFRKVYLNGTLICYNLDHNGFFVTSKLTNLWTKSLLEYGFFGRIGYREVARYTVLTPNFKNRSIIFFSKWPQKTPLRIHERIFWWHKPFSRYLDFQLGGVHPTPPLGRLGLNQSNTTWFISC